MQRYSLFDTLQRFRYKYLEISEICLIFATSIILIDMRLIALLLTMMLALSSMAQTAKPQDPKAAIRKHYAAAKAYIEQQQQVEDGGDIYPVTQCFTAQVKQNLPATGYHYEDVKMYYREELKEEGQIYPDLFLDFATKRYNFAAREYYEEYLYDQLGHIEFIYAAQPDLSEGKDYELRFYFHNGELIEVIIKSRQMGGGTFATIYQGNTVPAAYSDSYKSRLGAAKGIMVLFKTINANREL